MPNETTARRDCLRTRGARRDKSTGGGCATPRPYGSRRFGWRMTAARIAATYGMRPSGVGGAGDFSGTRTPSSWGSSLGALSAFAITATARQAHDGLKCLPGAASGCYLVRVLITYPAAGHNVQDRPETQGPVPRCCLECLCQRDAWGLCCCLGLIYSAARRDPPNQYP